MLLTDGIEACDGDPCAIALALQQKGITLRPFVIGIGLDIETIEAFKCVGHYYNADNKNKFKEILDVVISQATVATTAQVNLLDIYGKATETNVNMTFTDAQNGAVRHNYMHTMNENIVPDTLFLDPNTRYNIRVHTIPPVEIENVAIQQGTHNIISKAAPQGILFIKQDNGNELFGTDVIVKEQDEFTTLNIQKIGDNEKYIVGRYDLEILTIPRTYHYNVEVKQSKATIISVPKPGNTIFIMPEEGFASLYVKQDKGYEWVMNMNYVRNKTYMIQPGQYMVVYRSKNENKTIYTRTKLFVVSPGIAQTVNFTIQ